MHIPGHNPYQQKTDYTYLTSQTGDDGLMRYVTHPWSSYQYQGLSPNIIDALSNIFKFEDLDAFLPFTMSNFIDSPSNVSDVLERSIEEEAYVAGERGPDFEVFDYKSALPYTDIFNPESIAYTLSQLGDVGEEPIRAGEIQSLTPEMLEKTESQYYSPYEEAERETLIEKRGKNIAGAQTGGFAGSGGRQSGLSEAERLYRSGYGDIIADIMKMKASATGDVMDVIYGWQELLSEQT